MFMAVYFPAILCHAARLVEDAPGQIQRTITGGPFKFRDRRVNLPASTLDFRLSTLHVRSILFQWVRQRLSKLMDMVVRVCASIAGIKKLFNG
jgi:hypothetical protein